MSSGGFHGALLRQLPSRASRWPAKALIIHPALHYEHHTLGQGAYYAMPAAHSSTALKLCGFSDP
jgi:hypothetical protein